MKVNLESIRTEIREYLESRGMAVFYGVPRSLDDAPAVYWDTGHHPDYRSFLAVAETAGVRLVTLYANEFSEDVIEDSLERLARSAAPREERAAIEPRLRELRRYEGFTCQIELSFDLGSRIYIFDLRTDWFEDLNEILDRIDDASERHERPESLGGGGYFSRN